MLQYVRVFYKIFWPICLFLGVFFWDSSIAISTIFAKKADFHQSDSVPSEEDGETEAKGLDRISIFPKSKDPEKKEDYGHKQNDAPIRLDGICYMTQGKEQECWIVWLNGRQVSSKCPRSVNGWSIVEVGQHSVVVRSYKTGKEKMLFVNEEEDKAEESQEDYTPQEEEDSSHSKEGRQVFLKNSPTESETMDQTPHVRTQPTPEAFFSNTKKNQPLLTPSHGEDSNPRPQNQKDDSTQPKETLLTDDLETEISETKKTSKMGPQDEGHSGPWQDNGENFESIAQEGESANQEKNSSGEEVSPKL